MIKQLAYEDEFRSYLIIVLGNGRNAHDCISVCRNVESKEDSLYEHYNRDRGKSLMERLSHVPTQANLIIWEDMQESTQAVLHYFEYLSQLQE